MAESGASMIIITLNIISCHSMFREITDEVSELAGHYDRRTRRLGEVTDCETESYGGGIIVRPLHTTS